MLIKTVFDECGEDLSDTRCKSNWLEIIKIGVVVCGLGLGDQLDDSLCPSPGDFPFA